MSEEAAEATNKRVRQYRLRNIRKDTRLHTLSDLLGYLLVASDPLRSSRGLQRRRGLHTSRYGLLPESRRLLAEPELPKEEAAAVGEGSEDDSGSDDDSGSEHSSGC